MMRLITRDDVIDTYLKGKQRGWKFITSKFTLFSIKRTESAFNESFNTNANWWTIPYVRERWNWLITGDPNYTYEEFLVEDILKDKKGLKVLSLGSGSCTHEIQLAKNECFEKISCVDLSEYQLSVAEKSAYQNGLNNMEFICADIEKFKFKENQYDIVLFNASLHHFKNIDILLSTIIKQCLTHEGLLVINEFVGATRLQFSKQQIKAINKGLSLMPSKYKKRFKSKFTKTRYSGSGIFRMLLADPSECIDSISIMPSIHKHFKTVVEKPYGGNILMNVLKDISHHFIELDESKKNTLDTLFQFEDEYLQKHPSDFIFGVYKNKKHC